MYSYNYLLDFINKKIEETSFKESPIGLFEPMEYILSMGGKRLRPVLILMGCNLFNENISKAVNQEIGIELFHNFTLIHDDVMDNADIRRNKSTVHKKWNENVAILSGDATSIKAYEYIVKCDKEVLPEVISIFNTTALEVCQGQQYDMEFEDRTDVSIDEYIEMIRLKTAVLLGGSLKIGAIVGGANEKEAQKLYDFAINLGLAFQLQDDLLDSFGNVETFGKKIGGDILCNKKTFLLINALNLAKGNDKKELLTLINSNNQNQEKIDKVLSIYTKLDIKNITISKINDYLNKSIENLNDVNVDNSKKEELLKLVVKLKDRKY